jgi:hypothetical protein
MTALLVPGKIEMVIEHFKCAPDFKDRLKQANDQFTDYLMAEIDKARRTGDDVLNDSQLLAKHFEFIDELVKPESINEVVCAAFLAGKMIEGVRKMIEMQLSLSQAARGLWGVLSGSIRNVGSKKAES